MAASSTSGVASAAATAPAPGDQLRPAFRNDLQAAGFLLLVAVALASPVLLAAAHPFDRPYFYDAMREEDGAFSFVRHEIFEVKDDIDILFAGNSTLWAGIYSPIVQDALTQRLGRPARALTFGSYWPSMDVPYMEIRDALEHKHVRMIVLSIPRTEFNDGPSPVGSRFLSYSDPEEATSGLPLRYRINLYAGYVLRTPRDLLACLRTNPTGPSVYTSFNGSMASRAAFDGARFTRFTPNPPALPADRLIYSERTRAGFRYTGEAPEPYQTFYLHKIADLARSKGAKLVLLSIPQLKDRRNTATLERQNWTDIPGSQSAMVGLPPALLFRGLTDAEVTRLYYDKVHLNLNGSEFYTKVITPALLELYNAQPDRI